MEAYGNLAVQSDTLRYNGQNAISRPLTRLPNFEQMTAVKMNKELVTIQHFATRDRYKQYEMIRKWFETFVVKDKQLVMNTEMADEAFFQLYR